MTPWRAHFRNGPTSADQADQAAGQLPPNSRRLGQTKSVTVEYFLVAGSLDGHIAELLSRKLELIAAVEAEEVPNASILAGLKVACAIFYLP